jgi:dTMP kinase
VGREIRKLLLDARSVDLEPAAELLLYFASRAQNIGELIEPALAHGRIVIADRFTDATTAYQGYGRGLGVERVRQLERIACGNVRPDLTLWLDIDPALGVARSLERQSGSARDETRFEREALEFYRRVVDGYRAIFESEPERVKRIDAAGSLDQVEREILAAVRPALAERGIELP